jgi:hypothetical protein
MDGSFRVWNRPWPVAGAKDKGVTLSAAVSGEPEESLRQLNGEILRACQTNGSPQNDESLLRGPATVGYRLCMTVQVAT